MAFGGALAGLGGITGGFLDASSATLDFNQKQQKALADSLTGDALMSLQQGGALSGGAPPGGAGGGQPTQPPGAAPSPSAPSAPAIAPRTQREQELSPANWQSFSVGGGPAQSFQPSRAQPTPARAQPQTAQPPAQPQPQEQPYGGQQFAQQAQGQLTLQGAIQAVTQAARRRGETVTPDVVYKAVSNMVPLLNAQSQQQYREWSLMMREQQIGQREQSLRQSQERIGQGDVRLQEAQRHNVAMEQLRTRGLDLQDAKEQRLFQAGQFHQMQVIKDSMEKIRQFEAKQDFNSAKAEVDIQHKKMIELIQAYGLSENVDEAAIADSIRRSDAVYDKAIKDLEAKRKAGGQPATPTPGTATPPQSPPPIKWDPQKGFQ